MTARVVRDPGPACTTAERAVTQALHRAGLARALAAAFAYPTAPRVEELARATATLHVVASEVPGPADSLRDALATLAAAASRAEAASLADEYVFLFDRQVRCPPWESAWGDAPMMAGAGAALADIAGFYAAFGLEAGGQAGPDDHLAAEIEFMSALRLKEAWALAQEDPAGVEVTRAAAAAFLTDHLGRWAEVFAAELEVATPLPFYAAAARLLREWIRAELTAFDVSPTRFQGRAGPDPLQADTLTCPMAPEPDAGPAS